MGPAVGDMVHNRPRIFALMGRYLMVSLNASIADVRNSAVTYEIFLFSPRLAGRRVSWDFQQSTSSSSYRINKAQRLRHLHYARGQDIRLGRGALFSAAAICTLRTPCYPKSLRGSLSAAQFRVSFLLCEEKSKLTVTSRESCRSGVLLACQVRLRIRPIKLYPRFPSDFTTESMHT